MIYSPKPSISILVTCYNRALYIEAALDSILHQDYEGALECIIVDDASTDDSVSIIKRYIEAHKNEMSFRLIELEKNSGVACAMDYAMAAAKYEWFMMADSDDIQLPNRCSRTAAMIEKYPKVLMISAAGQHMSANGEVLDTVQPPFYCSFEHAPEELYLKTAKQRAWNWLNKGESPKIIGFLAFVHRSLYEKWGPLVISPGLRCTQDVTWFMRALLTGPVLAVNFIAIYYRQHDSNYENRNQQSISLEDHIKQELYNDKLLAFRSEGFDSKIQSLKRALYEESFSDWNKEDIKAVIDKCKFLRNYSLMYTNWWTCSIFEKIKKLIKYRHEVLPVHYKMGLFRLLPLSVFCALKLLRKRLLKR